jgi:hypothetical protein
MMQSMLQFCYRGWFKKSPHLRLILVKGPGLFLPSRIGVLASRTTGLLADDPDIKPHHFGDVMLTGKLLSLNVYFQIEMEN